MPWLRECVVCCPLCTEVWRCMSFRFGCLALFAARYCVTRSATTTRVRRFLPLIYSSIDRSPHQVRSRSWYQEPCRFTTRDEVHTSKYLPCTTVDITTTTAAGRRISRVTCCSFLGSLDRYLVATYTIFGVSIIHSICGTSCATSRQCSSTSTCYRISRYSAWWSPRVR